MLPLRGDTERAERKRKALLLHLLSLLYPKSAHVPVHAVNKRAKQDRKTRGRDCDRLKENHCNKRNCFILTDRRTVWDEEKFGAKQVKEIPRGTKNTKISQAVDLLRTI